MQLIRSLCFWLGLPLVTPQALRVRKTAVRFRDAAGPTNGRAGRGDPVALLMFGDSIAAGVGAATLDRALVGQTAASLAASEEIEVRWQAYGFTGANSNRLLQQLIQIDCPSVGFAVLSAGVNDITSLMSLRRFRENLNELLDIIDARCGSPAVAVAGIPPMGSFPLLPQPLRFLIGLRSRQFDHVARAVCKQRNRVEYVPVTVSDDPENFADDGYHPSEEGYAKFGLAIAAGLKSAAAKGYTP